MRFARALTVPSLVGLALVALVIAGCGSGSSNDGGGEEDPFDHAEYFTEYFAADPAPEVTNLNTVCVGCHTDEAADVMNTGHWHWEGTSVNIEGYETGSHGKNDLLNNFCIAIPSNEGRCTQCHIGVGYQDNTFDFGDADNMDCIICHDTTGVYGKHPTTGGGGGQPALNNPSEWPAGFTALTQEQWQDIGSNVGTPGRKNCGFCHYKAGGGNNVKHGDLAVNLNNTTREFDVHMGTDGGDFSCQQCHQADDVHGIGGMPIHHVNEGDMQGCDDCHSPDGSAGAPDHSAMSGSLSMHVGLLACQTCHIPAIGRHTKTKVWWDWSTAGETKPDEFDADGYITYTKKKGNFRWEWDVRPALRRFDGTWYRRLIDENDIYTTLDSGPDDGYVMLAEPTAAWDGSAKIYPFKRMIGKTPADLGNNRVAVPHLFGLKGGENPYWGKFDWDLALDDGATYLSLPYDVGMGNAGFIDTVMYLTVNHEVAPKEEALGYGNACSDCHGLNPDTNAPYYEWEHLRANGQDPYPNP